MSLRDIAALASGIGAESFTVRTIAVRPVDVLDLGLDAARAREGLLWKLDDAGVTSGWLWRLAPPLVFNDWGQVSTEERLAGLPLSGEFLCRDGRSVRLDHVGHGRWTWRVFHESADGIEMLADDVELLSAAREVGRIRYRRYWEVSDQSMTRASAARFMGFGGGGRG